MQKTIWRIVMIRTLIVDDEKYVRKGLIAVMPWDAFGYKVVGEASSGEKALEFLMDNEVDLVFTDLTMPSMSGFELMKELRKKYPDIYIVVLTCHQDFDFIQEALRMGAIDYIVKTQLEKEKFEEVLQRIAARIKRDQAMKYSVPGYKSLKSIYPAADNSSGQKYSEEVQACISNAVKYIRDNILTGINQDDVAKAVNISRGYFSACFRDIMGKSFSDYVKGLKIQMAEELLQQTNKPVYWIAEQLGFQDEKYFSKIFREQIGMNPSEYREQKRQNI
jgi:two-component system, response regulator YesN